MKKGFVIFIIVGIICVGYLSYYFNKYNIENSKMEIQNYLNEFNVTTDSLPPLEIIEWKQLNDSNTWVAHVLFKNKGYGFAHLKEGWNKRMEFISLETSADITYREFETNKGLYGVVFGENTDLAIDHIKVATGNSQYEFAIEVSNEKQFMKYEKLPENIQDTFPAQFTLYNANNNIINKIYFKMNS